MLHQNKHIKDYLFYEHASQNRAMQWPKKNHNLHEHIDNFLFSSPAPYLSDTLDSCPVWVLLCIPILWFVSAPFHHVDFL